MGDFDGSLEEIPWVPIVVGQKDPNEFDNKHWTSLPGDKFPLDIVVGLKYLTNVYKVVVDVHSDYVPSKIEVSVGKGDEECQNDYDSAQSADYGQKGALDYKIRERSNSRMEGKSLFTDHIGHFVWLVVHKPLASRKNPTKLVGINRVLILGYPMSNRPRPLASVAKSREPSKANSRRELESRQRTPSAVGSYVPEESPEYTVSRYSYEGDGMASSSVGLAGDPLTTVRTVQKVLREKMVQSQQEGRDVEATVCLRAIQRLDEYEVRLEDLSSRRSKALAQANYELAERLLLSMVDCRDTVFRAIHVDLLLDRNELRSIGVASRWTEGVEEY